MIETLTSVNAVMTALLGVNLLMSLRRPRSPTTTGNRSALAVALLVFGSSLIASAHFRAIDRTEWVPWYLAAPWVLVTVITVIAASKARWS